jgi:hypothetical protein
MPSVLLQLAAQKQSRAVARNREGVKVAGEIFAPVQSLARSYAEKAGLESSPLKEYVARMTREHATVVDVGCSSFAVKPDRRIAVAPVSLSTCTWSTYRERARISWMMDHCTRIILAASSYRWW